MDKNLRRTIIMIISILGLAFSALVLQILDITLGIMPGPIGLQFSSFPEMIASLAFGPFVGFGMIIAKEFFYFWLTECAFADIIGNAIIDSIFVVLSTVIYHNIRGGVVKKENRNGEVVKKIVTRKKRVFISGLLSALAASLVAFVVASFITIPMLISTTDATADSILEAYTKSAFVSSQTMGVLVFDVGTTFVEMLLSTIVASFTYKSMSRFMLGKFVR